MMNIIKVIMRGLFYVLLAIAAVGVFLLWQPNDDVLTAFVFTLGPAIAIVVAVMVILFPFWVVAQMRAYKKRKKGELG